MAVNLLCIYPTTRVQFLYLNDYFSQTRVMFVHVFSKTKNYFSSLLKTNTQIFNFIWSFWEGGGMNMRKLCCQVKTLTVFAGLKWCSFLAEGRCSHKGDSSSATHRWFLPGVVVSWMDRGGWCYQDGSLSLPLLMTGPTGRRLEGEERVWMVKSLRGVISALFNEQLLLTGMFLHPPCNFEP